MYLGRYVLDIFHLCKLVQKSGHLKKVADHAQFVYDRAIIFFLPQEHLTANKLFCFISRFHGPFSRWHSFLEINLAECGHPSVIVSSRPFAIRETGRSLNENEIFSWVKKWNRVYYYQTVLVLFVHKNRHQWIIYQR